RHTCSTLFPYTTLFRSGPNANRVRFAQRDISSWTPTADHYDLIVTHFFLDCFPADRVAKIVSSLSPAATDGAIWLLADFRIPEQDRKSTRLNSSHSQIS